MPAAPNAASWNKQLHSTVIPDILPGVTFFTLVAVLVSVICDRTGYAMKVNTIMLTIVGTMISFAISLRTSTANDRFNEGRRAWSSISLASRTMGFNIWVLLPPTTLTASQCAELSPEQMEIERAKCLIEKRTMLNLVQAFSVATKHYLRNEAGVYYEDLYSLCACLPKYNFPSSAVNADADRTTVFGLWRTPQDGKTRVPASRRRPAFSNSLSTATVASSIDSQPADLEKGNAATETIELLPAYNPPPKTIFHHVPPLLIFKPLIQIISLRGQHKSSYAHSVARARHQPETNIPLQITLFLAGYVQAVISRGTFAPSLHNTILAPLNQLQDSITTLERVLTTHLRLACYIYLFFLPFQTYSLLGFLSIVASFLAAVIFLGFMELGTQLENPFGYDDSDLPLDHYCKMIGLELSEIASHPSSDPSSYVWSPDNMPFPQDPRTAQEILAETSLNSSGATATWELRKAFFKHHNENGADDVFAPGKKQKHTPKSVKLVTI